MKLSPRKMLAAVLAIWLWLIGSAQAKPITLSYNTNALNVTLPIMVAQELGFFAGEGFEVTAVYVRSGPTAMAALVSGSADYTIVGSTTVVQAIAKGIPAVVIGNYLRQVNWVLMGSARIANLNSLKGQVVGVTSAGGMTEFLTVEALSRRGLKRDRDYRIHYSGNSPARVAALEANIIQAAAFSPAERVVLEPKGFPVLLEMVKVVPEFPLSITATSRRKLDNQSRGSRSFPALVAPGHGSDSYGQRAGRRRCVQKVRPGRYRERTQGVGRHRRRLFDRYYQGKHSSADFRRRSRGRSTQNRRRREVFQRGCPSQSDRQTLTQRSGIAIFAKKAEQE